nr:secretion activator protein [bacterium]
VKPIFRKNYWNVIGGDYMEPGFDYACYDFAVNSGAARAIRYSKNIAGATPEQRIKNLCAARLKFLMGLSTWPTFGRGWSRRVLEVQTMALTMARTRAPPPPDVHPIPPRPASSGFFVGLISALAGLFKRRP